MRRLAAQVFSYAGTKDKRAVTVQRVSAHRVTKERLLFLNKRQGYTLMRVGSCSYEADGLRLGQLDGNYFSIVLRNVSVAAGEQGEDVVRAAVRSWERDGFINYFGLQRFGSNIARNDEVGRALLLCDYVQAWPALSPRLRLSFRPSPRQRSASCSRLHHPASRPRRRRPWRACSRTRATG